MKSRARFLGGPLLNVGETAAEFFECPMQTALQTEVGQRTRARNEERSDFVFVEVRQRAAVAVGEHDAPVRSALRVNRNAGGAERVNVAIDGSLRDFQLLGENACRTLPARLEQEEKRNEPVGFHGTIKLRKYDSTCQVCHGQCRVLLWNEEASMGRVTGSVIFGGLALLIAGCSQSTTGALPSGGANRSAPMRVESETVKIREFADLPKYGTYGYGFHPSAIASGPGGLLWVVDGIDQDLGKNMIVGIATSGKAKHDYSAVSNYFGYQDIAAGPDGALWITDSYNNRISKMTTSGHFANYTVPNYEPLFIAAGPDRALWFTAAGASGGAIGRISTKGKMTFYSVSSYQLGDITAGPDNALWFAAQLPSAAIGRITTDGKITYYGISNVPDFIALGPDGALWFTASGPKIGRITTAGKVTEYSLSGASYVNDIAAGPDGAMWFTRYPYNNYPPEIGRISMSGHITEYSNGLLNQAGPDGIVEGPDERMWFTDSSNNQTGRVTP